MDFESNIHALLSSALGQKKLTDFFVACGKLSHKPTYALCNTSNSFDLASLTKPLVTTTLIMREIFHERISLDSSLEEFLHNKPNQIPKKIAKLKISSLLSHTAGFPAWRNFWMNHIEHSIKPLQLKERVDRVENKLNFFLKDLEEKRGFQYSDIGFLLLGICLEIKNEKLLSEQFYSFCKEDLKFLTPPLCYSDISGFDKNTAIATGFCPLREKMVKGEVHDENAFSLGGVCGHAGIFASGENLLEFIFRLFSHPLGQFVMKSNINKFSTSDKETGLCGWRQGLTYSTRVLASGRSFGHFGFTGTSLWILPETNAYVVFLTNRVISGRRCTWIDDLRREVHTNLFGILENAFK